VGSAGGWLILRLGGLGSAEHMTADAVLLGELFLKAVQLSSVRPKFSLWT
jgi:hypothetical protein